MDEPFITAQEILELGHVHLGRPGTFASALPNNPVSIITTENATC